MNDYYDGMVREFFMAAFHEGAIAERMEQMARRRHGVIAACGGEHRRAVLSYYRIGGPHPDDQNLPLNRWDEVE